MMRIVPTAFALTVLAATSASAQPGEAPPPALLAQFRADAAIHDTYLELDSVPVPALVEARSDLDGDGRPEVLLQGLGRYCGASGNCPRWIYTRGADGAWRRIHSGGGFAWAVGDARTNGFPEIVEDGHSSAYESPRTYWRYDGQRYVWAGEDLRIWSEDADTPSVAYRVRVAVPDRAANGAARPGAVTLETLELAPNTGVRVAAEYAPCDAAGTLCGTVHLLFTWDAQSDVRADDRCVSLYVADFDQPLVPLGGETCGEPGRVRMELPMEQWRALFSLPTVALRLGDETLTFDEGPQSGLVTFMYGVYKANGIDPYEEN